MEQELKGKCTHCGKPMKEESNQNWQVYCNADDCRQAFMKKVIEMKVMGIKSPYQK